MTTATNQLGMRSVLIPFLVEKLLFRLFLRAHWNWFKKQTTATKKYNVTNLGHSIHCQQYTTRKRCESACGPGAFSIILLVGMAISWHYSLHKLMSIPSNMKPMKYSSITVSFASLEFVSIQSNCRLFGMPALNLQLYDVRTTKLENKFSPFWYRIIDRKTNWWDVTWPSDQPTDQIGPTNSM